ncbi:DeoR family fructose operon transcriptional repressor [Breznakia sp. PF5-3]|uniref:DeoR/GlpR family DNA-binding transcription regulator n=1 Tax=unclassified Breznakia TaxID=2623764 RepID=UPI002406633C|nr:MULTISPECIES: DeoR/GlpR family DNA-binding transcription regulator [unclassified Breznakia]MDL2276271.1 DeoR/GlpR family DNA-binding transcription regulator [Breznakia sp. OttesenSCG-928-G09]MDF9825599.1 DeoR family fructose operon transcriptional repressor [Breznakia sp. PM6-1]MDF9835854.1 DeoR family fructose operon transcriptional repressor [Breznakia sp. PF5-3]MDF9837599.1 DeoR family fructose operon transcriptional repressor [Breznakia sp. PFB2-8]MDF9860020.1 DeoR family fructose opero
MLAKERLAYIIKRLGSNQSISVSTLSKELNVSLSTVQRDLRKLEKDGKIERERGGALPHNFSETITSFSEVTVDEKEKLNQKEKDCIARCASQVVEENECIFVDSGTTTAYLAPYLMNRKITIVTNSHYVVRHLRGAIAKILVLGGEYNEKYDMNWGSITIEEIKKLHFDRCFISANGFDLDTGEFYNVEIDNGLVKKNVMERSKRKYAMVDHTKFEMKAMYTFAYLEDFDEVYVDEYPKHIKKNKKVKICKEEKK